MRKEFRHALDDILQAIGGIQTAVDGKVFEDFEREWLLRLAIERAVEIISEASRAVPDEIKAIRPEIPWAQIKAIGNVLRHGYESLSQPVIWNVVVANCHV
jgi:uncharacterized protein with HEPN domain